MPNISKMNRELVRAFNINLCYNEVAITNLVVQNVRRNSHNENHVVTTFNGSMGADLCMEYLYNMKKRIVETFCGSENTANVSFDMRFFPFNFNERQLVKDDKGRFKFLVPINKEVIFNLKCLLVHALAKDAKEDMGNKFGERCMEGRVYDVSFDRESYLYCMRFYSSELKAYFINSFLSKIARYENAPSNYLESDDNLVCIRKSIFDNVEFIKDIVKGKASLLCRDFEIPSAEDEVVESLKFPIIDLLRAIGIPVDSVFHTSYTGSNENSVLVPITQITSGIRGKENCRLLNKKEVDYINKVFGMTVLNNIEGYTSPKRLPVSGNRGIYGIDFYDKDVSYCVMNKIIENSVINKDHRLTIDPELYRAVSPAPEPDERGGRSSRLPDWRTRVSSQHNQEKQISESPRQPEKEKGTEVLYHTIDSGNLPQQSLSAAAVGAGESVQEVDIWLQQKDLWLSQGTHEDKWLQSPQPGPSGLSQQRPSLWPQGSHSSRTSAWPQPMDPWSSPAPSGDIPGFWLPAQVDSRGKPLTEKEKELIKALLNVFNLNNRSCDIVDTNFTLKNGEIVSLLGGYVNREKYLQEVRKRIIGSHGYTEEEAKKIYNLDEFPFSFSPDSDFEEDERTTVLARNTSGAAFNLKTYLIQEFKEDIEEEVIEEQLVEKMKIKEEEARELIRRSVHLEKTNGSTSYLCSISFSNKCFQDQSRFERFKDTYIKAFELRLEKYGWNYSFKHNILYIESAINIDVIKKIEKHIKNEALIRYFIDEDEMECVPIVFEDGCFQLDISCSRYEELTPQRPKFTGSTLKTGKVKQETNDSGFSEGQTEDEKAMSKPSEKQGKSNAVGAGASVQEADIWLQQKNPWLLQGTHENKWLQSLRLTQPGPSGLSQQRPSLWPQGGHSSRTSAWPQPMDPWSSPASSSNIPGFWSPAQVDSRGKPLTEKEEELIKALLYAFNLNNYILECPNTNFIVENGKIASSINDGVNVKEYLQELRDYTIKEYCGTEEEAKEAYDLNEFPFKFLSNCEKNQEITVVANISRGALSNLKKLFIQQEHEQGIEDIDINIIEKTVKFQKDRWVDSQVKGRRCSPQAAITTCYPDESNLKHIPIIKDKGGYCLDRTYDTWEVKSFMEERRHAKGTSKDEKMKPEDNKDSGYSSSGFVTDAEKGKKSPKRKFQSPAGRGSPEKSPRRDPSSLSQSNPPSEVGSPDTSGGIKKQLPFVPFPQTQLTGPSSFSAMQYTGARKKVIDASDICPANPWAVPGTATFVPVSVSHIKSNIDKLGENFSRAIKVTEEGKLGKF